MSKRFVNDVRFKPCSKCGGRLKLFKRYTVCIECRDRKVIE